MRATQVVVNNSGLNRIQTLASTKCRDQGSHPILEYIIHYCLGSAPNHNEHMSLCASKPMLPSNEKAHEDRQHADANIGTVKGGKDSSNNLFLQHKFIFW